MSEPMGGRKIVSVGNYKFTGKRLGKGNFAVVEEAVHTILNTKVAIKIMDISEIKEEYVIRNLYREAKILSKLSHPSIATLFQTMQHGNIYYLVMELVGGGDLCNFIRAQRNGRLEEQCTRLFARQLISAISHMHNLGIVHRDLKMENVMLSPNNDRIKIVDFGLSNVYSGDMLLHTHCGSPEYAAPELFVEGKPYGPEVDLWSLGVILYGMAVGQLPFVSSSRDCAEATPRRKKLLEQINKGLSARHRKALALFSPDFKAMMGKLLVADSTKRINIGELIFHPWITENGRRAIRSNPVKKLDDRAKYEIIKEVASTSQESWQDVQRSIHTEPQGNFAGMFKLVAHRSMQHTSVDGDIMLTRMNHPSGSRSTTTKTSAESAKVIKSKTTSTKRQDTSRSVPVPKTLTVHSDNTKQAYSVKYSNTPRCFGDVTVRKTLAAKRAILTTDNSLKMRRGSGPGAGHPVPEKPMPSQVEPPLASRATRSVVKACAIQQTDPERIHQLTDVGTTSKEIPERTNPMRSPAGDAVRSSNAQCIFNIGYDLGSPANNTRSKKSKMDALMMQHAPANSLRPSPLLKNPHRTLSGTNKPTSNATNPNTSRSLTVQGPAAPRPIKRRSMLPVLQHNKTTANTANALRKSVPANSRVHQCIKSSSIDRPDDFKRDTNGGVSRKVDLSNEPIARSIAGYMKRNINNKVESVKKARRLQSMH